jgi:hypothetical protein
VKDLRLEGPYGYVDTGNLQAVKKSDGADETGVYMWAVPTEEGYMTTYIGITGRSFAKRTKEHAQCYLSGEYGTYRLERLKQGEARRIFPGTCRDAEMEEFIRNHDKIFPEIKKYLHNTEIFLIPLDGDKRSRERLESAISDKIRSSGKTGDLPLPGSPKQDYEPRQDSETVKVDMDENFIGLPEELEI